MSFGTVLPGFGNSARVQAELRKLRAERINTFTRCVERSESLVPQMPDEIKRKILEFDNWVPLALPAKVLAVYVEEKMVKQALVEKVFMNKIMKRFVPYVVRDLAPHCFSANTPPEEKSVSYFEDDFAQYCGVWGKTQGVPEHWLVGYPEVDVFRNLRRETVVCLEKLGYKAEIRCYQTFDDYKRRIGNVTGPPAPDSIVEVTLARNSVRPRTLNICHMTRTAFDGSADKTYYEVLVWCP